MSHKRILSQMFDVRPMAKTGDLDWEKIQKIKETIKIEHKEYIPDKNKYAPKRKIIEIEEETVTVPNEKKSWKKIAAARKKDYVKKPIPEKQNIGQILKTIRDKRLESRISEGEPFKFIRDTRDEDKNFAEKRKEKKTFSEMLKIKDENKHDKKYIGKGPLQPGEKAEAVAKPRVAAKRRDNEEAIINLKEIAKPKSKQFVGKVENIGKETAEIAMDENQLQAFSGDSAEQTIKFKEEEVGAFSDTFQDEFFDDKEELRIKETDGFLQKFNFSDIFVPVRELWNFPLKKTALVFAGSAALVLLVTSLVPLIHFGKETRNEVLGVSSDGVANLEMAVGNLKVQDFESSGMNFREAQKNFEAASQNLGIFSTFIGDLSSYVPFTSKVSSGKNAIEAGAHFARAGESLSKTVRVIDGVENPFSEKNEVSLLDVFSKTEAGLKEALPELIAAKDNLDKINMEDLPEDKRRRFVEIKSALPSIIVTVENFISNSDIFAELLGGNGPRKYLFLFQNNQEMRPTGGFIGSYGVLDVKDGRVRNFFVDGIFNPDGQLAEKIVPPKPIQKVSAAWSLHDSNWWPDFPKSAEKAMSFYEKTGGPTVDGIIALTPDVMEEFLKITGPIEMPEYDVILDDQNFVSVTQYEVEEDYDREENKPKKILADLAPIILDKIFNSRSIDSMGKSVGVISGALAKKQIIFYSQNERIQSLIASQGWSGEVLDATKDYLMVVNTNINGYKTDGAVDENIEHSAEILENGTVIDTLTITRHHNGGESDYEWWNKVNADYMRIYVPRGSKLLEIEGQTREFNEPPLDYQALNFKRDADVESEEKSMYIDTDRGVRVYEDSEKSVFAHWAYVSPGETVTLKYKYELPFKILPKNDPDQGEAYSIIYQKQSGSRGSQLISNISYPEDFKVYWKYPESAVTHEQLISYESILETDKFLGIVFQK